VITAYRNIDGMVGLERLGIVYLYICSSLLANYAVGQFFRMPNGDAIYQCGPPFTEIRKSLLNGGAMGQEDEP